MPKYSIIPSGVTLYPSTGQNTDGAMTQKATTDALADKADTNSLASVATSGDYDDLLNKPTIPSAQVNSDWNAVSGVAEILNKPTLATVATSGSYTDLSNTPTIPSSFSDLSGTVSTAQIANSAVTSAKIAPSVLEYRAGDTYSLDKFDIVIAGRQVTSGGVKKIYGTIALDKPVSSNVSSITFTPHSWCEAFGKDGTIFTYNTPSSSQLTFALSKVANGSNLVNIAITLVASVSNFTSNTPCVFTLYGNISFS